MPSASDPERVPFDSIGHVIKQTEKQQELELFGALFAGILVNCRQALQCPTPSLAMIANAGHGDWQNLRIGDLAEMAMKDMSAAKHKGRIKFEYCMEPRWDALVLGDLVIHHTLTGKEKRVVALTFNIAHVAAPLWINNLSPREEDIVGILMTFADAQSTLLQQINMFGPQAVPVRSVHEKYLMENIDVLPLREM